MMYTLLRRYFFCHLLVLFIVWVYPTQAFTEQSTKIKLSRNAQSQKSELFLAYHIIELSSPIKTDNQKSDKKVTIDKKRRKENENPILFLDNVSHYIEEEVPYQEKIMVKDFPFRKQSRTILYIFPRIRYMKERMCAFFRWFRQKDKEYSENNEIFGNIVLNNNNFGMLIHRSSGDTIYQNRLSNNIKGVWLSFSENNTVFRNNMTNNEHGLDIGSSSNNLIFENVISNNDIGVLLTSISSINNTIWNNDFVDNTKQAIDDSSGATLFWDNGSEGNYWSDYDGTDNNGDGIGDSPYIIDENNRDDHPLMEPLIIPEFPSWIVLPLFVTATLIVLIWRKKLYDA